MARRVTLTFSLLFLLVWGGCRDHEREMRRVIAEKEAESAAKAHGDAWLVVAWDSRSARYTNERGALLGKIKSATESPSTGITSMSTGGSAKGNRWRELHHGYLAFSWTGPDARAAVERAGSLVNEAWRDGIDRGHVIYKGGVATNAPAKASP